MINPFKQFNRSILKPLGILWDKVHSLENMRGDGLINIKRSGAGTSIGLNLTEARKRIAKTQRDFSTKIFQVRSFAEIPEGFEPDDDNSVLGIYNCIELILNENYERNRIADKSGFTPYRNNNISLGADYQEWDNSTSYDVGDIVEVTTTRVIIPRVTVRTYQAKFANTGKNPALNPVSDIRDSPGVWIDLTVQVLNLSESYTAAIGFTVALQPKLGKTDLIQASVMTDISGASRWAGTDSASSIRTFKLNGDEDVGATPTGDMLYGDITTTPVLAQEGELNYGIRLQNLGNLNFNGQTTWMTGYWTKGVWFMVPYFIPTLGQGITSSGTNIEAKVDGVTIGFTGTSQLKQLP